MIWKFPNINCHVAIHPRGTRQLVQMSANNGVSLKVNVADVDVESVLIGFHRHCLEGRVI